MANILITGATGGLGRALVEQFATEENTLYLVARQEDKLKELVKHYQSDCPQMTYLVADLSQSSSIQAVVSFAKDVDIVVHNAGYGLFRNVESFSDDEIDNIFKVNVLAPIQMTTQLLPTLYQKGAGHIVFVASQASKMVTPKSSLYSATKFALRGYANGVRIEAKKHGVHVMCVNPGPIDTAFFAVADSTGQYQKNLENMMLLPKDVAKAIEQGIKKRKREVNLPTWMEIGAKFATLFPTLADGIIAKFGDKK